MRTKIRRRPNGRWYLFAVDAAGQEHSHGGFRTRREAVAAAAAIRTDAQRRRYVTPGKLTVAEYLTAWLEGRQVADISPATRDLERTIVRAHVLPHLGDARLQEVDARALRALYATLRTSGGKEGRPLRGKTVRNCHGLLSKAFGDAVREGLLVVNPVKLVDPPARDDSVERQAWSRSEVRRFLEEAAGDRLAAVWRLALATGLRRGELLGLQWDDVDGDRVHVRRQVLARSQHPAKIYVRQTTKTRRARAVRIDAETGAALARWETAQKRERLAWGPTWKDGGIGEPGRWIVTEPDGAVVHPETLRRRFRAVARRAGVLEIPLHGARHSYATLALGAGVRLDVVSRQLGHSSISTTADIYTHSDEATEQEAAEKVAAAIFPPPNLGSGKA